MKSELPFGIDFVVETDLVPNGYTKRKSAEGYTINCPFCNMAGNPDKHHKLGINITKNVYNCPRCGASGGIIKLHADLNRISKDEAKKDLMNKYNGLPSEVKTQLADTVKIHQELAAKQLYPAEEEVRDGIYRKLLEQLSLSKKHHDDLIKRGLTDEEIEMGMYRSVPVVGFSTFAKNCFSSYETWKYFKGHPKDGVPGFYDIRTDEPKMVNPGSGYFVPVKTREGLISHLQIRFDELPDDASENEKEYWSKYKPFVSTGRNQGCSTTGGCAYVHFAGDWSSVPKQCTLTEGILKANVAASLAKRIKGNKAYPFIALDGVNKTGNCDNLEDNQGSLLFELFKLRDAGLERVVLALDMDYREKEQVAKAMVKIQGIIKEANLECIRISWQNQKGVDDFLKAVYEYRNGIN